MSRIRIIVSISKNYFWTMASAIINATSSTATIKIFDFDKSTRSLEELLRWMLSRTIVVVRIEHSTIERSTKMQIMEHLNFWICKIVFSILCEKPALS